MDFENIKARIYIRTAELAGLPVDSVGADTTLEGIGLDSSDAVILALEVEELVAAEVDVGVFLRFSTIGEAMDELARAYAPLLASKV